MNVLHVQKVAGISGSEAHLLQLLPALVQRGWDIHFLMLHEQEPGAWEFARALEAGGVPVDGIEMKTDVDPATFMRVLSYLVNHRPTILHTHLVHADAYGQTAGTFAGVPIRLSTKHGFNEFREGRIFALGDRTIGALAHRQIAISRGLARYLSETEGFPEPDFEIVHYGIAAGPRARAVLRRRAAVPLHRPPDPDQGACRAPACFPQGARCAARRDARDRGPRRARARPEGSLPRARDDRLGEVPRPRHARPARRRAVDGRRRAVTRRGLRDGGARGDGARPAGDRRRDRRPRGSRARRRDRPARRRPETPTPSPRRCSRSPPIRRRRLRWATRPAVARSSASPSCAAPSGPRRSTGTGSAYAITPTWSRAACCFRPRPATARPPPRKAGATRTSGRRSPGCPIPGAGLTVAP